MAGDWFPDADSYSHLKPRALYMYMPIIPRLRLLYAIPDQAAKLRYPSKFRDQPWEGGIRDVWEGEVMAKWREAGMFQS
jgi:hypothetical protein